MEACLHKQFDVTISSMTQVQFYERLNKLHACMNLYLHGGLYSSLFSQLFADVLIGRQLLGSCTHCCHCGRV